jgi:hypothetical protein
MPGLARPDFHRNELMTRPFDPSVSTESSRDPQEPASSAGDLHRLVPSRPRSELREALDAATGYGQNDHGGVCAPDPATDLPDGKKRTWPRLAAFFEGVVSNALGGVLATLIVALGIFLWTHFHAGHSHAKHLPPRPAATAATRR